MVWERELAAGGWSDGGEPEEEFEMINSRKHTLELKLLSFKNYYLSCWKWSANVFFTLFSAFC